MEQQKVFPTACFGFDKKVVLDYIYGLVQVLKHYSTLLGKKQTISCRILGFWMDFPRFFPTAPEKGCQPLEMGMDPNQKFTTDRLGRNAWQVALDDYEQWGRPESSRPPHGPAAGGPPPGCRF